jgi:hypothetical protein
MIIQFIIYISFRFIKVRRRSPFNHNRPRQRQNLGYVPSNGPTDVWTTGSYPPPTYEHIDESSQPINPPPSYNAALLLNYQSKENKVSSSNMMINSITSDNSNKAANDGAVLYRPNTQTGDTTNPTTNNINNNNIESNAQINDGEILIMFKQPNQDDSVRNTLTDSSSNDKSSQQTQNS